MVPELTDGRRRPGDRLQGHHHNERARTWLLTDDRAVALFAGFTASFPATLDYITFYKIKSSATLGVRFDIVFSVYGFFAAAMIVRYALQTWFLARGGHPDDHHPEVPTS